MKSNLRSLIFLIVAFSFSISAYPEEELAPWLVRENFESALGLWVSISGDCPFSQEELETIVEGEFLRARLIPTKLTSLSLDPFVACAPLENMGGVRTGTAIAIDISYASYEGSAIGSRDFEKHSNFSVLTIGTDSSGKPFAINSIKEKVSTVLTFYLKANLGQR